MNDWERQQQRLFSLTEGEAVVHRDKSGKVSPNWLRACKDARHSTVGLMDKVADPSNLQKAFKRVRANDGAAGVDDMSTHELGVWLIEHLSELSIELQTDVYHPSPVRGVEIRKPQGGYRQLGIPTAKDRLVQQALLQVLTPLYERIFSPHSHGFRPGRGCHGALRESVGYVKDGHPVVVDLDLAKFFDEVNHHRLMWTLSRRIGDERILRLIHRFIKAGLFMGGLMTQRLKGTPQGGPLSPLLSNIVLDELDKELERRGHHYVRYADDVKIFVKSEAAGNRVLQRITGFIESTLKLKVNQLKSRVCTCNELNFLGHRITWHGHLALSAMSLARVKAKIRELTKRNQGISLHALLRKLRQTLHGWLLYFRYASMTRVVTKLDSWIRRKLRCFRLKQCKRVIGIVRWLRRLSVGRELCWKTALSGKGWWRLSNSPGSDIGMSNAWFSAQGYYSLLDNYKTLFRTLG